MTENKLPILTIYSRSPLKYKYKTEGQECIFNAPERDAVPIEEYFGDAATGEMWKIRFDRLDDLDKKICNAVYPTLCDKDPAKLKSPDVIVRMARRKIARDFGTPCRRCGGSGSYARSVAYTEVDDGVCHLCRGSGRSLPRLTDKKLAEIAAHYAEVAK